MLYRYTSDEKFHHLNNLISTFMSTPNLLMYTLDNKITDLIFYLADATIDEEEYRYIKLINFYK